MRGIRSGRLTGGLAWLLALAAVPSLTYAHVGVGETAAFGHGLVHPLTGIDHIAAMVAVGLWAAQHRGPVAWPLVLSFLAVMAAAGLLGASGVFIPGVEAGIAASVLVLGVLIAAAVRLPLAAGCLLVGVFALFHGHAHGAEMPTGTGLAYGAGFVLATALLHGIGIALGRALRERAPPQMFRYAGGGIAALGFYLSLA